MQVFIVNDTGFSIPLRLSLSPVSGATNSGAETLTRFNFFARLFSKKSFGVQYTELFFPFKKGNLKDTFIRATGEGMGRLDDGDK